MHAHRSRFLAQVLRCAAAVLIAAPLSACFGFSYVNRDSAQRPERSTGSAARVVMPGEPMPSMESEEPIGEPQMIGGAVAEADASTRQRDVPLGPLATLFGFPFWAFAIL